MIFKREKRVWPRAKKRDIILRHVWQPHGWLQVEDEERCRDNVHDQFGVGFHQCLREPKKFFLVRGGTREYGFCTQHAKEIERELKEEGYLTR